MYGLTTMRRGVVLAASASFLVAVALVATKASAETSERGVSLGLRTGWALPMGALAKGDPQRSNFTGMLPLWIDAGYRFSDQIYLGAYFQWAALFVADDFCPKILKCSADDLRFGINAHWHFKRLIEHGDWAGAFDPWVGLGTGYESALEHVETLSGAKSQETNHGFEYANVQLGGDYVGGSLHVGAFASLAIAEYVRRAHTTPNGTEGFVIPDPAVHYWFFLGVRGQYDL
jgi:hypothetical protein